jgi:hypothetical protein
VRLFQTSIHPTKADGYTHPSCRIDRRYFAKALKALSDGLVQIFHWFVAVYWAELPFLVIKAYSTTGRPAGLLRSGGARTRARQAMGG